MILQPISRSAITSAWPLTEQRIGTAIVAAGSLWTLDDVRKRLESGSLQMWLIVDREPCGVVLTEIYDTARGKTAGLPITAADDMEKALPVVLATIEAWARMEGCVRLEGMGRMGWVRRLKPLGWRPLATVIEKELA